MTEKMLIIDLEKLLFPEPPADVNDSLVNYVFAKIVANKKRLKKFIDGGTFHGWDNAPETNLILSKYNFYYLINMNDTIALGRYWIYAESRDNFNFPNILFSFTTIYDEAQYLAYDGRQRFSVILKLEDEDVIRVRNEIIFAFKLPEPFRSIMLRKVITNHIFMRPRNMEK